MGKARFIDLFCGIGGFHLGAERALAEAGIAAECVFAADIDPHCQNAYEANFGLRPHGDIGAVPAEEIPDHEALFAGFPCQPFSIIGKGRGLKDTRGTLFFEIARIIEAKQPKVFVLENVRRLVSHDDGETLKTILRVLDGLGYHVTYKVLNALDYGLPQKRERVFIVGWRGEFGYRWPEPLGRYRPLAEILERKPDPKHFASEYIRRRRRAAHKARVTPSIWHENKSGNVSSHPFSCALRAGASYNYLLVNGERRLTPREMLRLQGFPDSYKIVVPEGQVRKQAGNAVPVDLVEAVVRGLAGAL